MTNDAKAERAAVVAWLRNDADCYHPDVEIQILRIADMIERGEHQRTAALNTLLDIDGPLDGGE